ncbi:MAG: DUF6489 family protein [Acetobacteraceae bacterium]
MKVTVEIDCTPDEARQFFGLPDVKPMQAAIMAKIEAQMVEAADRFSPDAILRSWMSMTPGAEAFRDTMEKLFKSSLP